MTVPERVVKGAGGISVEMECSVGTYEKFTLLESYAYIYDVLDVGLFKHKIGPISIPAGSNNTIFRVPERQFLAGRSYVVKWYTGVGFFASVIARSAEFEVTDMALEMKKTADAAAGRFLELQRKEKELAELATAKAEEKRQVVVEAQRNEQLSVLKAQAAVASKIVEEQSEKVRNAKSASDRIQVETVLVSQLEVRVFREYFDAMDNDGNGSVSLKELKAYLSSVGIDLTQKQLKEMFEEADIDHNGSIDFHEFISVMRKAKSFDATPKWRVVEEEISEAIQSEMRGQMSPLKKRALEKTKNTPTGPFSGTKKGKKAKN